MNQLLAAAIAAANQLGADVEAADRAANDEAAARAVLDSAAALSFSTATTKAASLAAAHGALDALAGGGAGFIGGIGQTGLGGMDGMGDAGIGDTFAIPPGVQLLSMGSSVPDTASALGLGSGPFRRLMERRREEIRTGLIARGVSAQAAAQVARQIGDGTILRLILEYGPQFIAAIIKLFGLI